MHARYNDDDDTTVVVTITFCCVADTSTVEKVGTYGFEKLECCED